MGDSFVDVTYRGLEVGRRLRIRDFTAELAYVEAPMPMPVGTTLEIVIDSGAKIAAVVARVHEQVGGSDRAPGMNVRPQLDASARAWWDKMIVESPAPPAASIEVPRAVPIAIAAAADKTAPASPESGPVVIDDGQRTQVMPAIDPGALDHDGDHDDEGGNGEIVDDGKRTQMMATVDIEAIMAQANAAPAPAEEDSGDLEIEVTGGEADEDVSQDGSSSSNGNGASSGSKKRKRRRSKKK